MRLVEGGGASRVLDHGNPHVEFETGAKREAPIGKGRYDLIPPEGMHRLARHYENGATKYGSRNWEKGMPVDRVVDSMIRHCFQYLAGDRSEDHLAAVAWNAFAIMAYEAWIRARRLPRTLLLGNDPDLRVRIRHRRASHR